MNCSPVLHPSQAAAYCKDIQKVEGYQAWIIGIVEKGNRSPLGPSLFSLSFPLPVLLLLFA